MARMTRAQREAQRIAEQQQLQKEHEEFVKDNPRRFIELAQRLCALSSIDLEYSIRFNPVPKLLIYYDSSRRSSSVSEQFDLNSDVIMYESFCNAIVSAEERAEERISLENRRRRLLERLTDEEKSLLGVSNGCGN